MALFQLRQYNKALSVLERLFKIVEPLGKISYIHVYYIYFNTAQEVFFGCLMYFVFSLVLHYMCTCRALCLKNFYHCVIHSEVKPDLIVLICFTSASCLWLSTYDWFTRLSMLFVIGGVVTLVLVLHYTVENCFISDVSRCLQAGVYMKFLHEISV